MIFKKGISNVLAISMLLFLTIISIVAFQVWFKTYNSSVYVDVEQKQTNSINGIKPTNFKAGNLYLSNLENQSIQIISASMEDYTCSSALGTYTERVIEINLTDCLSNQSGTGEKDIVIVTSVGVINYKEYIKQSEIDNYGAS